MAREEVFSYEARLEKLCSCGVCYTAYGIFVQTAEETIPLQHDVTTKAEEAKRICRLLNRYELEPEQARYVIEDCIAESYLM